MGGLLWFIKYERELLVASAWRRRRRRRYGKGRGYHPSKRSRREAAPARAVTSGRPSRDPRPGVPVAVTSAAETPRGAAAGAPPLCPDVTGQDGGSGPVPVGLAARRP